MCSLQSSSNNAIVKIRNLNIGQLKMGINLLFKNFVSIKNPKNPKQYINKFLLTDGYENIQLIEYGNSKIINIFDKGNILYFQHYRVVEEITNDYSFVLNSKNYCLNTNSLSKVLQSTELIKEKNPFSIKDLINLSAKNKSLLDIKTVVMNIKYKKINNTYLILFDSVITDEKTYMISSTFYNVEINLIENGLYLFKNLIYTDKNDVKLTNSCYTEINLIERLSKYKLLNTFNLTENSRSKTEFHSFSELDSNNSINTAIITVELLDAFLKVNNTISYISLRVQDKKIIRTYINVWEIEAFSTLGLTGTIENVYSELLSYIGKDIKVNLKISRKKNNGGIIINYYNLIDTVNQ